MLAGAFDLPQQDDPVVTQGKKAKGCFVTFSRMGLASMSKTVVKAKLDKFVGRDKDARARLRLRIQDRNRAWNCGAQRCSRFFDLQQLVIDGCARHSQGP